MRSVWAMLVVVAVSACGSGCSSDRPPAESGTAPSSSSSGGGFVTKPARPDACAAATKLVYVVSGLYDLLSFTPNTGEFQRIGHIGCLDGTPNSMALDRYGTAWVNYSTGELYKVSTADASCERTNYYPGQNGVRRFGMAFASDAPGGESETLFVNGFDDMSLANYGLAKIDIDTLQLKTLGAFTGALAGAPAAELTGTGDARLYGFFTTTPFATLAEIDKQTGATTNARVLEGVATGQAWAFSYWGGDFWFYTAAPDASASKVTRLAVSGDGSLSEVKTNAALVVSTSGQPFQIVGAGVSTCAPLEPPK